MKSEPAADTEATKGDIEELIAFLKDKFKGPAEAALVVAAALEGLHSALTGPKARKVVRMATRRVLFNMETAAASEGRGTLTILIQGNEHMARIYSMFQNGPPLPQQLAEALAMVITDALRQLGIPCGDDDGVGVIALMPTKGPAS